MRVPFLNAECAFTSSFSSRVRSSFPRRLFREVVLGALVLSFTWTSYGAIRSRVVGQAGEEVVTSREVQINHFVEMALFPDEKAPSTGVLKLEDKSFEKEVTRVLIEIVVSREAEVFNAASVPEDDVTKAIAVVRMAAARGEANGFWGGLAPTSAELKSMVFRKLRSKRFIQFKTRASVVPVTDAEALQYFQKNKARFGGAPFAQFKENIKSYLSQEQANARIRDWFELLQRKYKVKKVAAYQK